MLRRSVSVSLQRDLSCQKHMLDDLIHEVPRLWQVLSPEARVALSGCSRQLSTTVHNLTKMIYVDSWPNAELLMATRWPQLVVVVLRVPSNKAPEWLFRSAAVATLGLQNSAGL